MLNSLWEHFVRMQHIYFLVERVIVHANCETSTKFDIMILFEVSVKWAWLAIWKSKTVVFFQDELVSAQ